MLILSAITAIGAAISAGLSARLWSVIFAGVSAGASVINASLKVAAQIDKSEKNFSAVALLRASTLTFKTDLPNLPVQVMERRLRQLREQYLETVKLPQPSERELDKAVRDMEKWSRPKIIGMGNISSK